jgi:hypothetical protein
VRIKRGFNDDDDGDGNDDDDHDDDNNDDVDDGDDDDGDNDDNNNDDNDNDDANDDTNVYIDTIHLQHAKNRLQYVKYGSASKGTRTRKAQIIGP